MNIFNPKLRIALKSYAANRKFKVESSRHKAVGTRQWAEGGKAKLKVATPEAGENV